MDLPIGAILHNETHDATSAESEDHGDLHERIDQPIERNDGDGHSELQSFVSCFAVERCAIEHFGKFAVSS